MKMDYKIDGWTRKDPMGLTQIGRLSRPTTILAWERNRPDPRHIHYYPVVTVEPVVSIRTGEPSGFGVLHFGCCNNRIKTFTDKSDAIDAAITYMERYP